MSQWFKTYSEDFLLIGHKAITQRRLNKDTRIDHHYHWTNHLTEAGEGVWLMDYHFGTVRAASTYTNETELTMRPKSICINRMNRCVDPPNNMWMVGHIRSYVAHTLLCRKPLFSSQCVSCWSTECTRTLNPLLLLCIHSKIVIDSRRISDACVQQWIYLDGHDICIETFCLSVRSDCILSFLPFCPPFPPSLARSHIHIEIVAFTLCLSL